MFTFIKRGSKIFVSEQKNDVLEKIKKNITNNSSEKIYPSAKIISIKKIIMDLFMKIKLGKINLPLPNLLGEFPTWHMSQLQLLLQEILINLK